MKITLLSLSLLIYCTLSTMGQNDLEKYILYMDSAIAETNGEKSLPYSFAMLKLARKLNVDTLISDSYFELSHDYRRLGNYTEALNYAIMASEYHEQLASDLSSSYTLGLTYTLIGNNYFSLGNQAKSIEYYRKAVTAHKQCNYKSLLGDALTGIGEIFRLNNGFDSAFYYFSLADSVYKTIKVDSSRQALSNCNMGLVLMAQNKTLQADSLLQLSFDYYIAEGNYYPVCISYYEIAKKAFADNDMEKAVEYSKWAIDMALENNITEYARDIYLLLSEIAKHKKDFEQAHYNLVKYHQYQDSLVNDKVLSQMAEMRAEFEIGRKQTEVDYFKDISKARTNLLYVFSIALVLIFALALFLYRVNNKRKEANNLLLEYNEELTQKNDIIHIALQDKDVLMKEIHHRVKNNLQIISSIISLQNMRITDEKVQGVFSEMQRRILAISSIHQKLYQSESVSQINMKEYLEEVVDSIHTAFNNDDLNVIYEILVQNVNLSIDSAVSIGLIVNELTTNSYKYAFKPSKSNHLVIGLSTSKDGCTLLVRDNGMGIPKDIDILQSNSLGLRMVNLLARQLKGSVNIESDNGAIFSIFFEGMAVESN